MNDAPIQCPTWCTVKHSHPMAQREEQLYGLREHGRCLGIVAGASAWINRTDILATSTPGAVTVWAETEGDLNTEQSIRYAELVTAAVALSKEDQP
jgi:hypothetical protein